MNAPTPDTQWTPYDGADYLDADGVEAFCRGLADDHPRWVSLETVGTSRMGRRIHLLTIGDHTDAAGPGQRPALWLDGGTHAVEWASVMACLYTVSRWIEGLCEGDAGLVQWFGRHTAFVLPCISPDGVQAVHDGQPFLRSALRPPPANTVLTGLEARDMDADGAVRWMRWRDPAGPFVAGEGVFMRPRRLDDDPADAFFLCDEGELLNWDGVRWTVAPLRYGVDLNRNFPDAWRPFSMFGMDGGRYALSEPETRAVVDAFASRPYIACALTQHTYTGALLTAPSRPDDALDASDVRVMEILAEQAVQGTGYRVIRKHPGFVYDEKNPIAGCWDDTLTNTFGVCGYTLELWDPFRYAGIDNPEPAQFFRRPDHEKIRALLDRFSQDPGAVTPWRAFAHPQLGPVEIGGIDYLRTVRNPPLAELESELRRALHVADTLRSALPCVAGRAEVHRAGGVTRLRLVLDNAGFLPTSSLRAGETLGASAPVSASLELGPAVELVAGTEERALSHVDGWGSSQVGLASNSIYATLPGRGHRTHCEWLLQGRGTVTVRWQAGRAGLGRVSVDV